MVNFRLSIKTIFEEFQNAAITNKNRVIFKIINFLGPSFEIYIAIFNKKTYNKKSLPTLDKYLKSFKEEKICTTKKTSLNNFSASFANESFKNGLGSQGCEDHASHDGHKRSSSHDKRKSKSSNITDYTNIIYYC